MKQPDRLVSHEDALRIAAEVRECFEQAKRETEEMARKLDGASAARARSKTKEQT